VPAGAPSPLPRPRKEVRALFLALPVAYRCVFCVAAFKSGFRLPTRWPFAIPPAFSQLPRLGLRYRHKGDCERLQRVETEAYASRPQDYRGVLGKVCSFTQAVELALADREHCCCSRGVDKEPDGRRTHPLVLRLGRPAGRTVIRTWIRPRRWPHVSLLRLQFEGHPERPRRWRRPAQVDACSTSARGQTFSRQTG
jgi:hypothetical protein